MDGKEVRLIEIQREFFRLKNFQNLQCFVLSRTILKKYLKTISKYFVFLALRIKLVPCGANRVNKNGRG